jgi:hypothetical protein
MQNATASFRNRRRIRHLSKPFEHLASIMYVLRTFQAFPLLFLHVRCASIDVVANSPIRRWTKLPPLYSSTSSWDAKHALEKGDFLSWFRSSRLGFVTLKTLFNKKQFSALCMLLLAEPLPETIPLPASVEPFFILIVKEAIRSPSASTLWRVHELLNGACNSLPRVLPSENWISLEEELTHIVRSARTIQDQSMSLICFGIIYALATPDAVGPLSTSESATMRSDIQLKSDAALDFFSGNKAYKSLNLAALQVTWACKPNVGMSRGDVLKLSDIALDIFRVVDRQILEHWSKSSEGQTNIRRIISKLLETGLDQEIQLQVRIKLFL